MCAPSSAGRSTMFPAMENDVHILVIDDDRRIRELLQTYLRDNGFRVSAAASAGEARDKMRSMEFDLMVVDVMMPGESGLELTRSLREQANGVPILILSALAEVGDRIAGLTSGGDEYLPKPFEPRELLLRIQAILRRHGGRRGEDEEVTFGSYRFNVMRGELRRDGELVHLTTRERTLLRRLAQRRGETVRRAVLAEDDMPAGTRSVDVQINRLRRKIEDDPSRPVFVQTVRGVGYTLNVD